MLAEHIDSFRQRTKVRGENVSDRLLFVKNRWEKVVNDSKNDISSYRRSFSSTHVEQLKHINYWLENSITNEEIRCRIDELLNELDNSESAGVSDAYCFIIAELEVTING